MIIATVSSVDANSRPWEARSGPTYGRHTALQEAFNAYVDLLLARERNCKAPTTLGYLQRRLGISRALGLQLLRYFEEFKLGKVIVGRRGFETRFEWIGCGAYGLLDILTAPANLRYDS